jgi:hypothetical protein
VTCLQPSSAKTISVALLRTGTVLSAGFGESVVAKTNATRLYPDEPFGAELQQAAYALDSTTIDLCLSLFPWAKFRRRKAAIKLHTLLALRGNFPTVVILTTGKVHDVNILDDLTYEPGSFYVADRGYLDFRRVLRLYFVERSS